MACGNGGRAPEGVRICVGNRGASGGFDPGAATDGEAEREAERQRALRPLDPCVGVHALADFERAYNSDGAGATPSTPRCTGYGSRGSMLDAPRRTEGGGPGMGRPETRTVVDGGERLHVYSVVVERAFRRRFTVRARSAEDAEELAYGMAGRPPHDSLALWNEEDMEVRDLTSVEMDDGSWRYVGELDAAGGE